MKQFINVYDIDGVVAEYKEIPSQESKSHFEHFFNLKLRYKPQDSFYFLLSGRIKKYDEAVTVLWLTKHGILPWRYKLILMDHDFVDIFDTARFKLEALKEISEEYKSIHFYEDNKDIRDFIKMHIVDGLTIFTEKDI
jgi:hypothetical protein